MQIKIEKHSPTGGTHTEYAYLRDVVGSRLYEVSHSEITEFIGRLTEACCEAGIVAPERVIQCLPFIEGRELTFLEEIR